MARSVGQDSNNPENPNLVHAVEYLRLVSRKSWRVWFCRFGFAGLVWYVWFGRFGLVGVVR